MERAVKPRNTETLYSFIVRKLRNACMDVAKARTHQQRKIFAGLLHRVRYMRVMCISVLRFVIDISLSERECMHRSPPEYQRDRSLAPPGRYALPAWMTVHSMKTILRRTDTQQVNIDSNAKRAALLYTEKDEYNSLDLVRNRSAPAVALPNCLPKLSMFRHCMYV